MSNYFHQLNVKQNKKYNIYRLMLGFSIRRFLWDINYKSIFSKLYFKEKLNKYNGKKAVLMCNGPSLNKVDFKALKDSGVFVIGLNKINLLFDKTDLRPDLIVAINKLVIEQNQEFYKETSIDLILENSKSSIFKNKKNINYIYSLPFQLKFAGDVSGAVCQGYTVTYAALQIAFHFGFKEVALVGCDHFFETSGPSNVNVKAGETDPNHFHPSYFSGGVEWQLPDLFGSEVHYRMAREYYEAFGRRIYNCTDGGALEVFERKSLSDFLKND